MAKWAVFDVDGTLIPGISMEREFLRYLLAGRLLPAANLVRFVAKGVTGVLAHGWDEAAKVNKSYLRGLCVSHIDEHAEACFRKRIAPAISKDGLVEAETLRGKGYGILVISGAPAFLMRRLEPIVHPDHMICTELEVTGDRYSGAVVGRHPFGIRKRAILEDVRQDLDIDFSQSVVFANHHSDFHHMSLFGKAVAVNPTGKLRKLAAASGWEIAAWA
jgi:phosphoserine phosphatase